MAQTDTTSQSGNGGEPPGGLPPWVWGWARGLLRAVVRRPLLSLCLAGVLVGGLHAVWSVEYPPFGDYGGHVELMDAYARIDDPSTAYPHVYRVGDRLTPNTLGMHLAGLLSPGVRPDTTARLLLSWYVIALPLSLLAVCRSFGRTPWLCLFGGPLTYNAMLAMGALNFVVALPMLFFALALARSWARHGGYGRGVGLVALLVLIYFAHVLLYMAALGWVLIVLILHGPGFRGLGRAALTLLSLPLFVRWFVKVSVLREGNTDGRTLGGLDEGLGAAYVAPEQLLSQVHSWGLRFFRDSVHDEVVAVAIVCLWLGLMAVAGRRGSATDTPASIPRWGWLEALREYTLELITIGCIIAYFALPIRISEVDVISQRTVILSMLLLALWPRLGWSARPPRPLIAGLVVVALAYPWSVSARFAAFEREVVGHLPEALADLPDATFLAFTHLEHTDPVSHMGPIWHLPKQIHAIENGGVTNDSFAWRATSAVQYREGMTPRQPQDDFWRSPDIARFDYALLYASLPPPERQLGGRLELIFHENKWWLYEVRPPETWDRLDLFAGSHHGSEYPSACPEDSRWTGLEACIVGDLIGGVRMLCSRPHEAQGNTRQPDRVGAAAPAGACRTLVCPPDQVVAGLHGRAGTLVDSVGLICRVPGTVAADEYPPPGWTGPVHGGPGGQGFAFACPGDRLPGLMTGHLLGRELSALGVDCGTP